MITKESVALWTVIGGIAGAIAVVLTIIFYIVPNSDSGTAAPSEPVTTRTHASEDVHPSSEAPTTAPTATVSASEPDSNDASDGAEAVDADEPVSAPNSLYVADMTDSEREFDYTGPVNINGEPYAHTVADEMGGCQISHDREVTLGRDWETFESTIGVTDVSQTDTVIQFEIAVDGESIGETYALGYGEEAFISIPVDGVLTLRLTETLLEGDMDLCSEAGWAGWGNAELTR